MNVMNVENGSLQTVSSPSICIATVLKRFRVRNVGNYSKTRGSSRCISSFTLVKRTLYVKNVDKGLLTAAPFTGITLCTVRKNSLVGTVGKGSSPRVN